MTVSYHKLIGGDEKRVLTRPRAAIATELGTLAFIIVAAAVCHPFRNCVAAFPHRYCCCAIRFRHLQMAISKTGQIQFFRQ